MTEGMEGSRVPGDIVVAVKEEVKRKAEEIKTESDVKVREDKRQEYDKEIRKEMNDVEGIANETYVSAFRNSGNIPFEKLEDAFRVRVTVTKVLEAVKEGIIVPPGKSKYVLSALAEGSITQTNSVNLFRLIKKYLDKEITFSSEGESKTDFEKDFDDLENYDPASAFLLRQVIVNEKDHLGLSEKEITEKFKTMLGEGKTALSRMSPETFSNTLGVVLQRYAEPEDMKLLMALLDPETLEEYLEDFREKIKEKSGYKDEDKKLDIEVSEEFRGNVRMLVGKLFQIVDESRPDSFWQEATAFGGLFNSIEVVSQELLQRIQSVRSFKFSKDSIMNKIKFYRDEQVVVSLDAKVNPYFEEITKELSKEDREFLEKRKYALPNVHRNVEIDFDEYFFTVLNGANDEIEIRKFLHDARALVYHPPPDVGYHKQLSLYAERLTSSNIDHMNLMPDAESMLSASQLWAKLFEIDMAMHNWTHQPLSGQVDELRRLTDTDVDALKYLPLINPELLEDSWRLKRALIMGIGDNYSISLRALEIGAYADPPLRGGRPVYGSYGTRDSVIYKAFNLLLHHNLRWSNEDSLMGNLLFLDLSNRARDHTDLRKDMKAAINAFATGKTDEDLARGDVVRLMDAMNIGKIGGIYTRASWRMYFYYEGWLVDPESGTGNLINIVDSWKALEKIGVSALRDMVGNLVTDNRKALFSRRDEFFGKETKEPKDPVERQKYIELKEGLEKKRRSLVEHILDEYFKDDYPKEGSDVEGSDEKLRRDQLFTDLEKGDSIDEKAEAYKAFFHEALVRAYWQRIPTKFLTLERRRTVSTKRNTIWEEVRSKSGEEGAALSNEDFKNGVDLIAAAEIALKNEVKNDIKQQLAAGKKMHETEVSYELDHSRLESFLRSFQESNPKEVSNKRIDDALRIYDQLKKFVHTTMQPRSEEPKGFRTSLGKKLGVRVKPGIKEVSYFKDVAHKYQHGFYGFELGTEELQREFLTHRAAGERVVARNTNDNAEMEHEFIDELSGYFTKMQGVYINSRENPLDVKPLIEAMVKAKKRMEQIHGLAAAYEIIGKYFVPLTMQFFKKDDAASFFPLNIFRLGKKNCLAEEFVQGPFRGGRAWGASERRMFFIELERAHLLPKIEHDVHLSDYKYVDRKIFGIKLGQKKVLDPAHIKYSTLTLREANKATNARVVLENISKYLPLLILGYIAWIIYKSAKEAFSDKSRNS